jgi:hypothetical protein
VRRGHDPAGKEIRIAKVSAAVVAALKERMQIAEAKGAASQGLIPRRRLALSMSKRAAS